MKFTIKQKDETKCASCVHAFRIKAYSNPTTLNICRVLNTAVGKIEECNYHTLITYTQPPPQMILNAWMIDLDKKRVGKVGFGSKADDVLISPPPTPDELRQAAIEDPETFIVEIPSSSE